MTNLSNPSRAISTTDIQRYSFQFIDEFLTEITLYPRPAITLSFFSADEDNHAVHGKSFTQPVYTEIHDNSLIIHVCEEGLKGISVLALRGWLYLEMSAFIFKIQPEFYQYNFRKQILPLFLTSGSAVQLIRHLVEYLDAALKRYLATEMMINMGHGQSLLYYYYFDLRPDPAERGHYEKLIPHDWMRASFICRKTIAYMSIALLVRKGFPADLRSDWWQCRDYVLPADRFLMNELADIPSRYLEGSYAVRLIELLKTLQLHLLDP